MAAYLDKVMFNGHMVVTMKKKRAIAAGKFKATCLELIDRVAESREPYVVTKRGRPVVEIVPIPVDDVQPLRGSVKIHGDIVGPILDTWDVER